MTRVRPVFLLMLGTVLFGFWPHPLGTLIGFTLICFAIAMD